MAKQRKAEWRSKTHRGGGGDIVHWAVEFCHGASRGVLAAQNQFWVPQGNRTRDVGVMKQAELFF